MFFLWFRFSSRSSLFLKIHPSETLQPQSLGNPVAALATAHDLVADVALAVLGLGHEGQHPAASAHDLQRRDRLHDLLAFEQVGHGALLGREDG